MGKRMFSKSIVTSDIFLDMPLSSQALYFHLCMLADDYGFVSPKSVMRMVGANSDDLQVLIAKRYLLSFNSGVVVIKHWQINNTIRKDRSTDTTYQKEFSQLTTNEFGAYTEIERISMIVEAIDNNEFSENRKKTDFNKITTSSIKNLQHVPETNNVISENVNQMSTKIRLDKTSSIYNKLYILVNSAGTEYHVNLEQLLKLLINKLGFIQAKPTNGRKQKLKSRLKSYTATEIVKAAINLAEDKYMQGDNQQAKRYGTIDYLLRNDENIDKYLSQETTPSGTSDPVKQALRRYNGQTVL